MAEMLVQSESLTSIADKIRVLSGTEDGMSLNTMENHIDEANENVNTESELISQIMTALRGKTNIEIPEVVINTATAKLSSNGTSISFTGLTEEPKMFAICPTRNITLGTTRYVTSVMYDGSTTHGTYGYRSGSSGTSYYSSSYFTWTYADGTLTVKTSSTTNGGNFSSSVTYKLAYVNVNPSGGSVDGGVQLPILTNEGIASDLASGKQLINSNGEIVIGTHVCQSGGVTVQKTPSGSSFSTTRYDKWNGYASVNCGFKPDMVYITQGYTFSDEDNNTVIAGACFPFTDSGREYINCLIHDRNDDFIEFFVNRTSNGFEVYTCSIDTSWNDTAYIGSFNYTAVKYTA